MAQSKLNKTFQAMLILVIVGYVAWLFFSQESEAPSTEVSVESVPPAPDESAPAGPWGDDGYYLQFAPDYNPGLNSLDDLGIAVLLAVDVSGSMMDPPKNGLQDPKYIQASRALTQILDFLEKLASSPSMKGLTLKVGIITFYAEVTELAPLTVMDEPGFKSLRSIAANPASFEPGGKTAIGLALQKGAEMLSQSGTIFKSLIVVSDGENTEGPEPGDVLAAVNENRNNRSTSDVPVLTRGILTTFVGFDIDAGTFAPLEQIGSRVSAAADQEGLKTALQSVLMADITKLEKAGN